MKAADRGSLLYIETLMQYHGIIAPSPTDVADPVFFKKFDYLMDIRKQEAKTGA